MKKEAEHIFLEKDSSRFMNFLKKYGGVLPIGYHSSNEMRRVKEGPIYILDKSDQLKLPKDRFITPELRNLNAHQLPKVIVLGKKLFEDLLFDEEALKNEKAPFANVAIPRTFVYFDITEFTKEYQPHEQLAIINEVIYLFSNQKNWKGLPNKYADSIFGTNGSRPQLIQKLCIGDGYIFVFQEVFFAVLFACYLALLIEYTTDFDFYTRPHFRLGIHTGLVYQFWDPGRNGINYIGEGINGGQRILGAMGKELDDTIYVSDVTRSKLINDFQNSQNSIAQSLVACMDNRGRKKDKHEKYWRIYQLDHMRVGQQNKFSMLARSIGNNHFLTRAIEKNLENNPPPEPDYVKG